MLFLWLQEQINNHHCPVPALHVCPPCSLTHLSEPHVCPIINQIDCSHGDYWEIKKEQREQQIIHQFNHSLNLGLNNPNLEQVIEKIQELINKQPNRRIILISTLVISLISISGLLMKLKRIKEKDKKIVLLLSGNNTVF